MMQSNVEKPRAKNRTTIVVTKEIRARLHALKEELGFKSLSALFSYTILELTKEGLIPPAEYFVIFDELGTKPVIVTGESGLERPRQSRSCFRSGMAPRSFSTSRTSTLA